MDKIERLEALVIEQAQRLESQAQDLRSLRARIDAIQAESDGAVGGTAGSPIQLRARSSNTRAAGAERPNLDKGDEGGLTQVGAAGSDTPASLGSEATSALTGRREIMRRAGVAAVGAAAGGAAAVVMGPASPAAAATGTFSGNPAVDATGVGGYGVSASSDTTSAVRASTSTLDPTISATNKGGNAIGADGTSAGVYAIGGTYGVRAESPGYSLYGGIASSGTTKAQIYLGTGLPGLEDPTTRSDSHVMGEIYFDRFKTFWACVGAGIPGTWRRLAGPSTAGALTVLTTPVRVYDSRPGFLPATGTKSPLVASTARSCDLKASSSGVPAGATAVLVSLTATNTTGAFGGFLSIYRNGVAWPGTSSLNWSAPGQTLAVTTLTAVDATGLCALYANVATDVVVDVLGYYR